MFEKVTKSEIGWTLSTFLFITLAMLAKEFPLLHGTANFIPYILGKTLAIFFQVTGLIAGLLEINLFYAIFPYFFYFLTISYLMHGQVFQPNYWLGYMEFVMIYPFIFYMSRVRLGILMTLSFLAFNLVFYLSVDNFINKGSYSKEFYYDAVVGTAVCTYISFVASGVLMAEKIRRFNLYQRFIDLGKNMSSIAHDIKGMISGPTTYVDMLSELSRSSNHFTEKEIQLITYLNEDVYAVRDFVLEMNNLVSSQITNQETLISISAIVKSIKKVFKSKIRDINIVQIGDLSLFVKVDYINRILINAIVNSSEVLHKNRTQNAKITIYCEDNLLGVADNSGEKLDDKTLKIINGASSMFTNKQGGSGLGIMIIRDYVEMIGGKMKYSNQIHGVSMEIKFPRKILSPEINRTKTENLSPSKIQ
jgi:signal transduction histidine kinase